MAKTGSLETDHRSPTIWLKPPKRSRDVPALTRERIVQAAVEILDSEGQNGLTIRKLGARLNAGATSLYWHVETRDDVLELALDSILGEISLPTEALEWDKELVRFLTDWRQTLLRHPWSTSLVGFRPLLGPNALARSEHLRATLMKTGLPEVEVIHAGYTVSNFMLGSVATQVAWQAGNESATRASVASFLRENAAKYPSLSSRVEGEPEDWDESFSRGLSWIIRSFATS
jgi:AcrR family transcriptional regulator